MLKLVNFSLKLTKSNYIFEYCISKLLEYYLYYIFCLDCLENNRVSPQTICNFRSCASTQTPG